MRRYTVLQPFGEHKVGDVITSAAELKQIHASEQAAYIVQAPEEVARPTPKQAQAEAIQGATPGVK